MAAAPAVTAEGAPAPLAVPAPGPEAPGPQTDRPVQLRRPRLPTWPSPVVVSALVFSAVETGVESGAGIWGYLFLTAGRGLSVEAAGVAVSLYWAMMFIGRAVLGPVAERVGATPVLGGAVAGVLFGAALMTLPAPAYVGVIGMMVIGLAAAPIFPLLTLTTRQREGTADARNTTRTASLQVAVSAIGAAALPALIGGHYRHAGRQRPSPVVVGLQRAVSHQLRGTGHLDAHG